jgi:hypothetical protein
MLIILIFSFISRAISQQINAIDKLTSDSDVVRFLHKELYKDCGNIDWIKVGVEPYIDSNLLKLNIYTKWKVFDFNKDGYKDLYVSVNENCFQTPEQYLVIFQPNSKSNYLFLTIEDYRWGYPINRLPSFDLEHKRFKLYDYRSSERKIFIDTLILLNDSLFNYYENPKTGKIHSITLQYLDEDFRTKYQYVMTSNEILFTNFLYTDSNYSWVSIKRKIIKDKNHFKRISKELNKLNFLNLRDRYSYGSTSHPTHILVSIIYDDKVKSIFICERGKERFNLQYIIALFDRNILDYFQNLPKLPDNEGSYVPRSYFGGRD